MFPLDLLILHKINQYRSNKKHVCTPTICRYIDVILKTEESKVKRNNYCEFSHASKSVEVL